MKSPGIVLVFGIAASLPMTAPLVEACMVCVADPMERVLVTELRESEEVVLARPSANGKAGRFQIVKVLKSAGETKPGSEVEAKLPLFSTDGGKIGRGTVVLTRRDGKANWIIRAPASGLHQVLFFQKTLALPPVKAGKSAEDDARRAAFFLRYLHHADPLLAKAAAAEIAGAPYAALKTVKEKLDLAKIREQLQNPAARERRALYYTLLGVCGTEEDAAAINKTLESLWKGNGFKNLAALLTAWLELEGETAVDEIETRYFRDRSRTLPEIEAAVLALRVHGNTDDTISRDRVIAAYRSFFDDRQPLVFYIAADLARWEDWESKERLVAIAEKHGDDLLEVRREVDAYLERCPTQPTTSSP